MRLTGGGPAGNQVKVLLVVGGTSVGALSFGLSQCQGCAPLPPPVIGPEPVPTVPAFDASVPDAAPDAADGSRCQFKRSVARTLKKEVQRIVGGERAPWGEYRFAVSMRASAGYHYCTGSVVGDGWVLTAGHCQPDTSDRVAVWPGYDPSNLDDAVVMPVRAVRVHPEFDGSNLRYDMALVYVGPTGIAPVPIAASSQWSSYRPVGWGKTCASCPTTKYLQEVDLNPKPFCSPGRICAGGGGKDACNGDSGGPLLVDVLGTWHTVGVTSYGDAQCVDGGAWWDITKPEPRQWLADCMALPVE